MVSANGYRLQAFLSAADVANHTYYAERRSLLDLYHAAVNGGDRQLAIPAQQHIQIRLYLMSRSDSLKDDARLAFETALVKLREMIEEPGGV